MENKNIEDKLDKNLFKEPYPTLKKVDNVKDSYYGLFGLSFYEIDEKKLSDLIYITKNYMIKYVCFKFENDNCLQSEEDAPYCGDLYWDENSNKKMCVFQLLDDQSIIIMNYKDEIFSIGYKEVEIETLICEGFVNFINLTAIELPQIFDVFSIQEGSFLDIDENLSIVKEKLEKELNKDVVEKEYIEVKNYPFKISLLMYVVRHLIFAYKKCVCFSDYLSGNVDEGDLENLNFSKAFLYKAIDKLIDLGADKNPLFFCFLTDYLAYNFNEFSIYSNRKYNNKNPEIMKEVPNYLISKGFDINGYIKHDWEYLDNPKEKLEDITPLMRISIKGDHSLARFLISLGADKSKKDKKGLTALDYAELGYKYERFHRYYQDEETNEEKLNLIREVLS